MGVRRNEEEIPMLDEKLVFKFSATTFKRLLGLDSRMIRANNLITKTENLLEYHQEFVQKNKILNAQEKVDLNRFRNLLLELVPLQNSNLVELDVEKFENILTNAQEILNNLETETNDEQK